MRNKRKMMMKKVIWGVMMMVMVLAGGCSPRVVYVPTESVRLGRDTLRIVEQRVDSVVVRDSMTMAIRGDTVEITRWRERTRVKLTHDTVYRALRDSIKIEKPYPVEVIKEVKKPLPLWQKLLLALIAIPLLTLIQPHLQRLFRRRTP